MFLVIQQLIFFPPIQIILFMDKILPAQQVHGVNVKL